MSTTPYALKMAIAEAVYHGVNDACNLSMCDCENLADQAIERWNEGPEFLAETLPPPFDPLAQYRNCLK